MSFFVLCRWQGERKVARGGASCWDGWSANKQHIHAQCVQLILLFRPFEIVSTTPLPSASSWRTYISAGAAPTYPPSCPAPALATRPPVKWRPHRSQAGAPHCPWPSPSRTLTHSPPSRLPLPLLVTALFVSTAVASASLELCFRLLGCGSRLLDSTAVASVKVVFAADLQLYILSLNL